MSRFEPKKMTGKIGVQDGKYDILGSSGFPSGKSDSLFEYGKQQEERRRQEEEERELIHSLILKEKAKRHEKELRRQLNVLQQQAKDKERELVYIKQTYKL
jgi:hypothetical protein